MSVAMEICRIAEDQVGLDALCHVREIGVVVGRTSGVEPESLRFCLEALLANEPFRGARPTLELTSGDDLRVHYLEIDDDRPPH
ncbi:MAG: hydrogenase maturation nickel metallochaperone HypA [Gemmatimonadota bacterium]|nr:hydrogenase maturation nickel metallochaperone HypA [Gemmatimonadota bacterium]